MEVATETKFGTRVA